MEGPARALYQPCKTMMNIYFSKVIKAGERQREFNFRQLHSEAQESYSVDVPDDKGNRVIFSMSRNEDGQWNMSAQTLPSWILHAEPALGQAIEENTPEQVPVKKRRK
jgi:hypothetical protein